MTLLIKLLLFIAAASAQTVTPLPPSPPPGIQEPAPSAAATQPETKITADQAKQLFRSVDEILQFVSQDTGLPIRHHVKRKLADRAQVENYITSRMRDDEDAKRLQRGAIVLKKFGLLPPDFDLLPFLLSLLKEQVAGYYDSKTKTVYLLDWVEPEQQKPVLAHELTHALQDQNFGLDRMEKDAKKNDPTGLLADERDAARQAVLEGQGMIVLLDYMLAPLGASVAKQPQIADTIQAGLTAAGPEMVVFNHAPMFMQQVLLFPYHYGTLFERDLLVVGGKERAFNGALAHLPEDTRQIMHPLTYVDHQEIASVPLLNFEKLVPAYKKWDVSLMGEFDAFVLLRQLSSEEVAKNLSAQWRGGYYWAGKVPNASPPETNDGKALKTSDVALVYVSRWSGPGAAARFAGEYSAAVRKRYPEAHLLENEKATEVTETTGEDATASVSPRLTGPAIWETPEGRVTVEPHGDTVLVMESFDPQAAKAIHDAVFP